MSTTNLPTLIGDWAPTDAEAATVKKAVVEAITHLLRTSYRFEPPELEAAVLEALSSATLVDMFDSYVNACASAWDDPGLDGILRDIPPRPELWDGVERYSGDDGVMTYRLPAAED